MTEALKKGCTQVAFGDMADHIAERVEPTINDSEKYIGLEHLDSGSLTIRRWGTVVPLAGTKLRMRKGDILFAKRNAYLRRVAIAPHDGLFSAHGMVLRPKDKVILPEFLPFFMQSDLFMERAKQISVGSLSPTINWKTLAKEEFVLPPIEEQKKISKALININNSVKAYQELSTTTDLLLNNYINASIIGEQLGDLVYDAKFGRRSKHLRLLAIGDLLEIAQYGLSLPSVADGKYSMIRMMDLSDGFVNDDDLCFVNISETEYLKYRLEKGDVLFNRTNSHELVGRTGIYYLEGEHVFASYLIRLKTATDKLLPEYLTIFLNSLIGRKQIMKYASKGVSQTNINASNLKKAIMPLPNIEYQEEVINHVQSIRSILMQTHNRTDELNEMMQVLVNNHLEVVT